MTNLRSGVDNSPDPARALMFELRPPSYTTASQPSIPAALPASSGPLPSYSHALPNVIVFGETGTGKSSLINMLGGAPLAGVSSQALGFTFASQAYDLMLAGKPYRVWDTAGLNEGQQGTIPADVALGNLKSLIQNMGDGVSLLVYCIRGTRFRDILRFNYDMFTSIICQNKVPVVLVITGLENESPMDSWWDANKKEFKTRGLKFDGHACVTTTKGKQARDGTFMFQEEYEESETKARDLVATHCSSQPWKMESARWMSEIGLRMAEYMQRYNQRTGTERDVMHLDSHHGNPNQYRSRHPHDASIHHGGHFQDHGDTGNTFASLLQNLLALMGFVRPALPRQTPTRQLSARPYDDHRHHGSSSSHNRRTIRETPNSLHHGMSEPNAMIGGFH